MKRHRFDLVVVGAGSGGYAAARTARALGASVALVDHGPLGGLCILRGCMPSKTVLATSTRAHDVLHAGELAVAAGVPRVDVPKMTARKRTIVQGFADYRIAELAEYPIFEGNARFLSPHALQVGDDRIDAKSLVIATGSVVSPPALPGLEEAGYLDSDSALELETVPPSAIVLGGGYVACELGQHLARLGAKTTILIRAPHVLSGEDGDVGEALGAAFADEGIAIEARAQATHVEMRDGRKVVRFQRDGVEGEVAADEILYALGRLPNVAGMDLEAAGVRYHTVTGIEIGPALQTSASNIFAVGDVTGDYPLVHIAIYQGEIAARNAILGTCEPAEYALQQTHTVFTEPQVAVAGYTEKQLQRSETAYLVAKYPFADHGKAIAIGKTKGFVKMLAAPDSGRIIGAAVVGAEGSDLIHEVVVAMYYCGTVQDFVRIPHLHPTLAEIWTYPAEEIVAQMSARAPAAVAL